MSENRKHDDYSGPINGTGDDFDLSAEDAAIFEEMNRATPEDREAAIARARQAWEAALAQAKASIAGK